METVKITVVLLAAVTFVQGDYGTRRAYLSSRQTNNYNSHPSPRYTGYTDYTGYRGNQHAGYNSYQHRQTTEYTVATNHQQPHSYTYQGERVINGTLFLIVIL